MLLPKPHNFHTYLCFCGVLIDNVQQRREVSVESGPL